MERRPDGGIGILPCHAMLFYDLKLHKRLYTATRETPASSAECSCVVEGRAPDGPPQTRLPRIVLTTSCVAEGRGPWAHRRRDYLGAWWRPCA
eukprot:scaffold69639_cov88-Phaeocystis_antarctica.AAC.1